MRAHSFGHFGQRLALALQDGQLGIMSAFPKDARLDAK